MDYTKLSQTISHALRHEPQVYGLTVDEHGWVALPAVVNALSSRGWPHITTDDIVNMVETAQKKRHEIADNKIRAFYGHTVAESIVRANEEPPEILYHGTVQQSIDSIRESGLQPMKRNYVHLSEHTAEAVVVADRKKGEVIVLQVRARDLFLAGGQFHREVNNIWLTAAVPAEYILF